MLPNFLIIGAEKAATTWLYTQLSAHPDVFMPQTKEAHFFNKYDSNLEHVDRYRELGVQWYERLFRGYNGEKAVGEATPMYLCDPVAPERIRNVLPEVKLVACLRDPVDRAYSHYWMAHRKGHTELSFEEAVAREEPRFIRRGLYGEQLKRYYDLFPEDRILVIVHEELFDQPDEHIRKLCAFIDVDPAFYRNQDLNRVVHGASDYRSTALYALIGKVATWMRKRKGFDLVLDGIKSIGLADRVKDLNRREHDYPPLDLNLREQLATYYKEDIRNLEQLTGVRFDAWRSARPIDRA